MRFLFALLCFLSEERPKFCHADSRIFQDVCQCRALDWRVRWNGKFERLFLKMLLKTYVTASLSHHDPTVALKGADNLIV